MARRRSHSRSVTHQAALFIRSNSPQPFVLNGNFNFEIVQSPENSLRDSDALLGMVAHAGGASRVLIEQLYEYKYWGPTSSNPIVDPNPRLEAYIAAARRGAVVRLLLDSVYNDPLESARQYSHVCLRQRDCSE